MRFAFLIFKYFPFGGVQRDMLRMASALADAGHQVDVYTMSWQGEVPSQAIVPHIIKAKGFINHKRYASFIVQAQAQIAENKYDLIVGFNRMRGLDVHFAADPCFVERAHRQRSIFYKLSGRYRWFSQSERAVFGHDAECEILLLSEKEKADFQHWYKTPDQRFHLLPPYLSAQRMVLQDQSEMRSRLRSEFGWNAEDVVVLMVGSGFRAKGLDRTLQALAALPPERRSNAKLLAVGQDNAKSFKRLAYDLGLRAQVEIVSGRADIPQLMQGADVLIHPARAELAGHVLLEAMASGLPVLVTDVCGYAHHIAKANAGVVLASPFDQKMLNTGLLQMLDSEQRASWASNGIAYSNNIMASNDGTAEAKLLVKLAHDKKRTEHGIVL